MDAPEPSFWRQGRAVRAWSAALAVLCVLSLWLQFGNIERTLPYPLEPDETAISGPATRILQKGTLHPTSFIYPSLPTYLTALGMAAGFLRSAAHLEVRDIQQIGNTGFPYYGTPGVLQGARQLFAVLAVLALVATGAASWHAFRVPALIFLAPLLLWASPLFFHDSWAYLNVDIVATCFAAAALAACLQGTRLPSFHQSAVIPAAFVGLAAGSKYTLVVAIAAVLVAIGLHWNGSRRLWAGALAIGVMIAAFLIVVPYSLITLNLFLDGVAWDAMHYGQGHIGFDGDPGLPQLAYYASHLVSEFGVAACFVGAFGLLSYVRADWRRTVTIGFFPAALLWTLASQRVHFPRNVLPLQPVCAMFVAYGVVSLHGFAVGLVTRRSNASRAKQVAIAMAVVLLVAVVPVQHVWANLRSEADSRVLAEDWIQQRVPAEWTIVVPPDLNFDRRALAASGRRLLDLDLRSARDRASLDRLLAAVPQPAVVLVPHWGADSRFPGQDLADALNDAASGLRVVQTLGANPVLTNYPPPTAWGNPALAIALLAPSGTQLR